MAGLRNVGLSVLVLLLITLPARAVDQEDIDKSVKEGVAYLKKQNVFGGAFGEATGATALIGLTLLECGSTAEDPSVSAALQSVREASPRLDHTYSIALAILLLDRNGDAGDIALIESLAVRLIAGQNNEGGWSYNCPPIDEAEVRRLTTHLKQQTELRGRKEIPVADPKDPKAQPARKTEKDLPKEIQQQLAQLRQFQRGGGRGGMGDNSNTQFATLGLWVARRHGLPVDGALRLVEQRYRASQGRDGGWAYVYAKGGTGWDSSATMTCAGLLGLAVSYGIVNDQGAKKVARDPKKDDNLKAGLVLLSTAIGQPTVKGKGPPARGMIPQANGKAYYFLWSLERVAVALDLKTIGKKDWYGWGCEVLIANQQANGSWQGDYANTGADTCFALLFLRRANLARDLTASFGGKFSDPGEITLKTGGVGGDSLTGKKAETLKSPLQADEKKESSPSRDPGPKPTPLSSKEPTNQAVKLGTELVKSEGKQREQLLKELRDAKGQDFTDALADVIRQLEGEPRNDARQALAERLTRMTAKTLRAYMEDTDPEIRRAAALASGMKDCRENIPSMIELLKDRETTVVRATHAALKAMTGKDFGPAKEATASEQAKAVAAWQDWWKTQSK